MPFRASRCEIKIDIYKRCKSCAHWSQFSKFGNSDRLAFSLGLGICGFTHQFWSEIRFLRDEDRYNLTEDGQAISHFVQDGSDYFATLYTRPEFGCTSFQAAPTTIGIKLSFSDRLDYYQRQHPGKSLTDILNIKSLYRSEDYARIAAYLDDEGIPYSET